RVTGCRQEEEIQIEAAVIPVGHEGGERTGPRLESHSSLEERPPDGHTLLSRPFNEVLDGILRGGSNGRSHSPRCFTIQRELQLSLITVGGCCSRHYRSAIG